MYEKEIELKIQELPEDLRRDVLDYMGFLLKKLSCNIRPRSGDDVLSGHECIFGNILETG